MNAPGLCVVVLSIGSQGGRACVSCTGAKYNNEAEELSSFLPAMANRGYLSEPSGSLADANIISVDKNLARDTVRTPNF